MKSVPSGISSLERFGRAASMIQQTPSGSNPIARAFTILDSVHQPDYTRWSIVYDPAAATVYFRTDQNVSIRQIALASFDGGCATPVQMADVNASSLLFSDYDATVNRELVYRAYAETPFLQDATDEDKNDTATHPDGDVCIQPRRQHSVRH